MEYDFLSSEEENSSLPSNVKLKSDTAENDAAESDPDDIRNEKVPPNKHKSYAEIEVRPGRRKGAFSASQLLLMETPKSWGGSYRCTLGSQKSRSSSVIAKFNKPLNSSTSPTPNYYHLQSRECWRQFYIILILSCHTHFVIIKSFNPAFQTCNIRGYGIFTRAPSEQGNVIGLVFIYI